MLGRDRVSHGILSLTLFMFLLALALNVTSVADLDGTAHQSTMLVSEPERRGMLLASTPHGAIVIDGDASFSDTALLEGWPGDGSPENPYIIDGLDIDLGGAVGNCISIYNTRVSFTISNCDLPGASNLGWDMGAGIYLENVTDGELVNNTCNSNNDRGIALYNSDSNTVANNTCTSNNDRGIALHDSDSNTVANNTCTSNNIGISLDFSNFNTVVNSTCNDNDPGIFLHDSDSNTVANNTCNSNRESGIELYLSDSNTVANNTCTSNTENGITLWESISNTVANNTCSNNDRGIFLGFSNFNTVANNTCNNNNYGISLDFSNFNTVVNNTCTSNTEHGITLWESISNTVANNTCNSHNYHGITLHNSDSNTVVNNTCSNNDFGIALHNSDHNIVDNNICNSNNIGIYLEGSDSNTVANNNHVESAAEAGIHVEESRNNVYTGNWITECRDGFYIVGGDSSNFTFNYIRDNWGIGIDIDHGSNNVFFGNLLDNDENAWEGGTNNQWDDGSNIGNYWGGVSFSDSVSVEGSANSTDDFPLLIDESDLSLPVIGRTSNTNGQYITEETTMTWVIWSRPGTYTLYLDSEEIESGLWSGSGPFRIQVEIFAPGVHSYELIIDQFDGGVKSDLVTAYGPGIEVFLPHITALASTSIVVIALLMELRKKLRTPTVPAFVSIVKYAEDA